MKLLKRLGIYSVIIGIHVIAALVFIPVVLFIAATEPKQTPRP